MATIATINDIPVYNAEIGENEGMLCVSLVDMPAVNSDFLRFAAEKPILFAVQNEEKKRVLGVVMRANYPIFRRGSIGDFYMVFKPDTIRQMAQKYLADHYQNQVDKDHDGQMVKGVEMVQWFIKDTAKGVNPQAFPSIADGSLFAEYQITDDRIWEEIKNGTYKGFSLEGYFSLVPETDKNKTDNMAKEYAGQFRKDNQPKPNTTMAGRKKKSIKEALASLLAAFGSITTDKGILAWDGDEDIKVGDKITIEQDGEKVAPEDGEYKTEDGTIIVIAGGEVTEIKEAEQPKEEEKPADEAPAEEAKAEEEAPAEPAPETPAEEPKEDPIPAILERLAALESANADLVARIEALEGKPAAEDAHKEFKKEADKSNRAAYLASLLKR